MSEPKLTMAQQIARAVSAFQQQGTGHPPKEISVVLSGDTLVVTMKEALSPAEKALAQSPAGAAQVREFHRQLFAASAAALRQEIHRITGVEVCDAGEEIQAAAGGVARVFTSGTMVQVFLLARDIPAEVWNGGEPREQT